MCGWSQFITHVRMMLPTLDGCPSSKFLGTNLDSFEPNWMFEFDLALDPNLHLGSSNHELSFLVFLFFGVETNWFSLQSESHKLDPPPLDENAWPKSGKIKAKYCDQWLWDAVSGEAIIGMDICHCKSYHCWWIKVLMKWSMTMLRFFADYFPLLMIDHKHNRQWVHKA